MAAGHLQKVPVMLAKGIDQGRDDYTDDVSTFARFENAYLMKQGRAVKRRGFEALSLTDQDGAALTELRGCFSTGKELALIGRQYLYTHNETWGRVVNRGPVSPFVVKQSDTFRSDFSHLSADCATVNGYTIYAAHRQRGTATAITDSLDITVVADDGSVVVSKSFAEYISEPSSPRCATVGNYLIVFYANASTTSPATLSYIAWDTSAPSTSQPLVSGGTNVSTDLLLLYNRRTFDAIRLSSGELALAWIDHTNGYVNLDRWNTSLVSQATSTLTTNAGYSAVALSHDTENDRLNAIVVGDNGESGSLVETWARNDSTLAAVWGPIGVKNGGLGETYTNVGCASANGRLGCSWGYFKALNGVLTGLMVLESAGPRLSDGADLDNLEQVGFAFPTSRPFYLDGRFYVCGATAVASNVWDSTSIHSLGGTDLIAAPYEANCVWDLNIKPDDEHWNSSTRASHVAAAFDIGTAGGAGGQTSGSAVFVGGGNNVIIETDAGSNVTGFRMMTPSIGLHVFTELPRFNHSETTLSVSDLPNAIGLGDGSAFVGGGLSCWYDGEYCHELHFIVPPIFLDIEDRNDGNSPGLSAAGAQKYQWVGMYSQPDAMGRLHRSQPSPPVEFEFTAADTDETARLTYRSTPASNRNLTREWAWHVFRSADDLLYRRAMPPLQGVSVTQFDDYGQVAITEEDAGAASALPLYTSGDVLATVTPNPCNAMAIAGGRLWLGDFARRVRVQYSKPFAPGTATEDQVAPDFNEGFGYVLPRGLKVTLLAEMDGATIVGSDEALYTIVGQGPTDTGAQNDFSGLRQVQSDTGCLSQRSVAKFPDGIMFQGPRGIHMLDRGLSVTFVGFAVVDETDAYPVITSATLVEEQGQVRFTCLNTAQTEGIVLVYDYVWRAWYKWTPLDSSGAALAPVGACVHDGRYVMVEASGNIWRQSLTSYYDDATQYVPMRIRTAHVQTGGHGGHQKVVSILPTLRREDHHALTVNLYRDFAVSPSESHAISETQVSRFSAPAEKMRPHVKPSGRVRRCSAMAVELVDEASSGTTTGAGYSLSGFTFFVEARGNSDRTPRQQRI